MCATTSLVLAAAGARVVYRAIDVRDGRALAGLLTDLRREFGPVRGLIHGAGVLADARIEDKTTSSRARLRHEGRRSTLAARRGEPR